MANEYAKRESERRDAQPILRKDMLAFLNEIKNDIMRTVGNKRCEIISVAMPRDLQSADKYATALNRLTYGSTKLPFAVVRMAHKGDRKIFAEPLQSVLVLSMHNPVQWARELENLIIICKGCPDGTDLSR